MSVSHPCILSEPPGQLFPSHMCLAGLILHFFVDTLYFPHHLPLILCFLLFWHPSFHFMAIFSLFFGSSFPDAHCDEYHEQIPDVYLHILERTSDNTSISISHHR